MAAAIRLDLDGARDRPLYRQIVDQIWIEVARGTLDPGDRLPTVRGLAIDLSVHPDTVARAYKELELLGVAVRRPGEGTFVGLKPPDRREFERRAEFESLCQDIVGRAKTLGFSIDELIETLSEFRSGERPPASGRSSS